MIKQKWFFCAFIIASSLYAAQSFAQLISIAAARQLPPGSTVNVQGVCINGSELGTIRYIMDGTAGIAIFSQQLVTTTTGDEVNITGTTVQFSNLLEINPVTSWTLNTSGNPLPAPTVITPILMDEPFESQLVRINDATFANGGATFQGNSTYQFSANGQQGVLFVRGGSPLIGLAIPATNVDLIGICTQYQAQYQLVIRAAADIVATSALSITVPAFPTNINTSGFDVNWQTNVNSSSLIKYGKTPALELGMLSGNTNTTSHTVTVIGANPSEIYYVQPMSVLNTDTAIGETKMFITASGSSGSIKAYFNRSVDNTVAAPQSNLAIRLNNTIDDTLKAYLDRANLSADFTMYSFDDQNTAKITQAINDAYNRGVQIRIIIHGPNLNTGLNTLNANIPVLFSPDTPAFYYGLMHNKFLVIDANSTDVNAPIVWTGSTNFTDMQLNTDANNVIIVQDKSLAKAYTIEFEEMWGSSGMQPNLANIKFGPKKSNNTPHEFNIGGKRVECYFSPSDNVNSQIERTINTADNSLQFSCLVFTRFDLAYAIQGRIWNGVVAYGMVDDSANGGGQAFSILYGVMNNKIILYDHQALPGILHHKYLIVDQDNPASDALVLTGSHNWSSTANLKNDENTLVVHDPLIANQYYQEFVDRFNESGGGLGFQTTHENLDVEVFPNPAVESVNMVFTYTHPLTVTVYDAAGSQVGIDRQHITLKQAGEKLMVAVDVHSFSKGMYILQVQTATGTSGYKFVKQ